VVRQSTQTSRSRPNGKKRVPAAQRQQQSRGVLNRKHPPPVGSIAHAVVIKDEDVYFLTDRDGRVPLERKHGFGLYYHDCRFLNGYELQLAGQPPGALVATTSEGFRAELELANPDFHTADGRSISKDQIGVHWERTIDARHRALHEQITFRNYAQDAIDFPVSFRLRAEFEDVFIVRGMTGEKRGKLQPAQWKCDTLFFHYVGTDGIHRHLQVHFDPAPERTEGSTAHFQINVPARENRGLKVSLLVGESAHHEEMPVHPVQDRDAKQAAESARQTSQDWLAQQTRVESDRPYFDAVLRRSLLDLRLLRTRLDGQPYFSAGVPWYVALFGRDSLISALQALAYEPRIAGDTLRLLARYQGTKVDDERDEQPGKIMH
jgi:glycogen debranching enzyme